MKIAIAITGASGAIYAMMLLRKLAALKEQIKEAGLVMSANAEQVWEHELGNRDFEQLPFPRYAATNFYAPFASGSAGYDGLIICPCSMGTLGRIAGGVSNDLTTRAADVMLKERKKLICVVRETPYNLIHLNNMTAVTAAGGIICPATPSFYSIPKTLEEAAETVTDRVLQLMGVETGAYQWPQDAKKNTL